MLKKILCVDDESIPIEVYKKIFKKEEGYDIISANNGEEARERIKEQGFGENGLGFVITDFNMPGIKGSELIRIIREGEIEGINEETREGGRKVSICLVSGYLPEKEKKGIEKYGTGEYGRIYIHSKPFDIPELRNIVEREFQRL
jgi:CheY-like chemotaxis protein